MGRALVIKREKGRQKGDDVPYGDPSSLLSEGGTGRKGGGRGEGDGEWEAG